MKSNVKHSLIAKFEERSSETTFANIPFTTQKVLVNFMAIRGDSWSDLISEKLWALGEWNDCQWGEVIEDIKATQGFKRFKLFEVPTGLFTQHIHETCDDINNDYECWQEYHKWYSSSHRQLVSVDIEERPACIYSGGSDVLEDGWSYLHSYVASRHDTIPLIAFC